VEGNIQPLRITANVQSAKTLQLAKLIYGAFKMKLGRYQIDLVLLFQVSHKLHRDYGQHKILKRSHSEHRHNVGNFARRKYMLKG
jgi:hypothetical protein